MIYALFTLETFLPLKHSPSFFSPIFLREKKNFSSLEIAQEFRYNHHWNIEVSGFRSPIRISFAREKALNSKVCFQGRAARMRISRIHGQSLLGIPTCVKQASLLPPREWTSARSKPYFPIRCSLAQCLRAMQSSQPHEYVIRACAIESKPIGHSSHLPSRVFRSRYRNCFGTKFLKYSII